MTHISFKNIDDFIKQFNFDKNIADLACLSVTDIFNRYCPTLNWYLKEIYRLSYTMGPKQYSRTYIFEIASKDVNWQTVKGIMTISTNVDSDSEQCGEHSFFFREVRLIEKVGSMHKLDDAHFVINKKSLLKESVKPFTDIEKKIIKAIYGEEAVKSDFDKPISTRLPTDQLLSGGVSLLELLNFMPTDPLPKSNIRNHMVMHLLIPAGKRPFGNFKIKKVIRNPSTDTSQIQNQVDKDYPNIRIDKDPIRPCVSQDDFNAFCNRLEHSTLKEILIRIDSLERKFK